MVDDVLKLTPHGLYCAGGDFFIDPVRPVDRAVITHGHADHARPGSGSYLCVRENENILRARLGRDARIQTLFYGEVLGIGGVRLSLHPAGHILGSAQVRVESRGHVTVVSGDYKTQADPTCAPFEPLCCHRFIGESTFGLPVFRWPDPDDALREIEAWWRENQDQGCTSVLFAYALGKAQRILAGLDPSIGPILTHEAVEAINRVYRETGIALPETLPVGNGQDRNRIRQALVIAPVSADNPDWLRRFPNRSRAFVSGWMRIRENRRKRAVDRGFVISDHSDWQGLVSTIAATGADRIAITHGYVQEMVRWLREQGFPAEALSDPLHGPVGTGAGPP